MDEDNLVKFGIALLKDLRRNEANYIKMHKYLVTVVSTLQVVNACRYQDVCQ